MMCRLDSRLKLCTHKDKNVHTHSFRQIYKAAQTPGSVFIDLKYCGTGRRAHKPHFRSHCRNGLKIRMHIDTCACSTPH